MKKQSKLKLAKTGKFFFGALKIIGLVVFFYVLFSGLVKPVHDAKMLTMGIVLIASVLTALVGTWLGGNSEDWLENLKKTT